MEDFANILHRDYGLKPQGKLAPMAAGKSEGSSPVSSIGRGKNGSARTSRSSVSFAPEGDDIFFGGGTKSSVSNSYGSYNGSGMGAGTYDDVFGGPPKFTPPKQPAVPSFDSHDSIFRMPQKASSVSTKESASPIFDMPTYDDDIFGGVRGTRAPGTYDNVFGAESSSSVNDDLLGGFKQSDPKPKASSRSSWQADPDYDDLLPGFRSDLPRSGSGGDSKPSQETERSSFISVDSPPRPAEVDPFGGLASEPSMFSNTSSATYSDDLDPFNIPAPVSSKQDGLRTPANGINDGLEGFDAFSPPPLKPSTASRKPLRPSKESAVKSNSNSQKEEIKSVRRNFSKMADSIPSRTDAETKLNSPPKEKEDFLEKQVPFTSFNADRVPESMPEAERVKETWLTIDDVRLLTQPTAVPPPPRPPPGYMRDRRRYEFGGGTEVPQEDTDSGANIHVASSIEEFEEFASGRSHAGFDAGVEDSLEDEPIFAAAATMKDAIDRTQAKLKVAKEAKENGKDRAKEIDRDEREARAAREREEREKEEREKEEREKERQRKEREREKEREKDRAAVQRATQEARERAAQEAKEKAERAAVERATAEARERAAAEARQKAAERAAVEKAAAEARLRAERAAVERANAEARERAAAEARERANAETRERAAAADARAAVERANAEARERAAAEARERVAASRAEKAAAERAAREREAHRKADDLESIFGTRPSSAPRQRPPAPDIPETRSNKNFSSEIPRGGSGGVRKVASATNIDDWTSLFATPSSSEFQEVDGEPPERRKARWERHQQTLERAAKALAEKKQRDVDVLRQQAEKDRISESLNAEIKRWAAGKEGNLRALLSTLQYVLWPECGWQPVSLTDLITGASVKKVYRKATLCVHPDKVQQKGATVQQSYIAEKVFDLLKEAWNKFNSEELF